MSIDPVIATILRYALGWLFLAAAAHKLKDLAEFRVVLAAYRLFPQRFVDGVAWCVVAVEFAIGVGSLFESRAAYVSGAVVLLVYAAAMALSLARGRRLLDCGCGGTAQPLSIGLVSRNVVIALVALVATLPVALRPLGWFDVVSEIAGVLVFATLYASINALMAAHARLEEWV